jgi:hypothetical protein
VQLPRVVFAFEHLLLKIPAPQTPTAPQDVEKILVDGPPGKLTPTGSRHDLSPHWCSLPLPARETSKSLSCCSGCFDNHLFNHCRNFLYQRRRNRTLSARNFASRVSLNSCSQNQQLERSMLYTSVSFSLATIIYNPSALH